MYFQKKGTVKKNGVFLIKGVTYTHNTLAGITDRHFTLYPNLCIFTHHACRCGYFKNYINSVLKLSSQYFC